jgi:signal transduction histidine kinase
MSSSTDPTEGREIFRPYARLISILGDQLITSKWVGVIELVKNCYDADANKVSVRFLNFDVIGQSPVIEIEDDGDGMTIDIIRNVWMKPATPHKLNQKKSRTNRYTKQGRLMQGDKGVGRFAIYKLGHNVEIFTKTENTPEVNLSLNFREYAQDDEFSDEEVPEKFLDEIENEWKINEVPVCITNKKGKGTLIRITDLRNRWTYDDLGRLEIAFQRMIPPVIPNFKGKINRDFDVNLYWNDGEYRKYLLSFEDIIVLAPFSLEGSINDKGILTYIYKHNTEDTIKELDLFDISEMKTHDVWNLKIFKEQFLEKNEPIKKSNQIKIRKQSDADEVITRSKWKVRRRPNVGECFFHFYAFDWKNVQDLDENQRNFIRDNSVYLYRDFTRVYPYGEKGIDWLMLSKLRAEDKAARYFSYNDLIGFIFITQQHNPRLRDAANREGLMNVDGAYDDFVALIQAALKVMKDHVDIDKRKDELRKEKAFTTANQKFQLAFNQLKDELAKSNNEKALIKAQNFFKAAHDLVDQYRDKLSITQELAGVGMAVEKSSHDIFVLLAKMIENADEVVKKHEKGKLSGQALRQFLADLKEDLEVLYQEVQILQPLFRVARKVTKEVSVKDAVERVERYYQRDLRFNITFKIEGDTDIIVKTNMGLMLQVFINLVDNSIYWLNQQKSGKRAITVRIDSINNQVVFADNGPGISEDLAEIVFSEFYSTKADGRGLGLYIVKELLDRINATISLITTEGRKLLPGANFLIQFPKAN